jgi:hypothetical protein
MSFQVSNLVRSSNLLQHINLSSKNICMVPNWYPKSQPITPMSLAKKRLRRSSQWRSVKFVGSGSVLLWWRRRESNRTLGIENAQVIDSRNAQDSHDFQNCQIYCTVTIQSFPRITRTTKAPPSDVPVAKKEHSEVPFQYFTDPAQG